MENSSFAKKLYIDDLTQIALFYSCNDRRYLFKVIEEVILALKKQCAEEAENIEKWEEEILNKSNNKWEMSNSTEILKRDGSLISAAMLVRLNGMLPYYLARLIACVFAHELKRGLAESEIAALIALKGVKEAIKEYCGLNREVELIKLIADQFKKLLNGIEDEEAKIAKIKQAYEWGYNYEKVCRGCAQCTIAGLFHASGKKDDVLFRAANGFSAGMGLFGDGACGGYAGGILFMGMYAGRRFEFFNDDRAEKEMCYKLTKKLHDKFIETYGTVICEKIHESIFGRAFHLRNSEDKAAFEEAGAHTADKCTAVVATSAQWVMEILIEEGMIIL